MKYVKSRVTEGVTGGNGYLKYEREAIIEGNDEKMGNNVSEWIRYEVMR